MNLRKIMLPALLLGTLSSANNANSADFDLAVPTTSALTAIQYQSVTDDTYNQNINKLFSPASTMKLLTAVAATAALGAEFHYKTRIFADNAVKQGVLAGNLYISFNGDPSFTSKDLQSLLLQLKQQGLQQINGNVYLVGELGELSHAPGRVWDDLGICYAAPVASFIINKNCISAQFLPKLADDAGEVKIVGNEPVSIASNAVFDKTEQQPFCELTLARLADNHFSLEGCYPGDNPLNLKIAITDPALFLQGKLTTLLAQNHIKVNGDIAISARYPLQSLLLAEHQSAPLKAMVATMLLKSDNLIADSLLKRLGQQVYGGKASFAKGSAAIALVLAQQGVDLQSAHIVDGSGLSRYNLLSANHLSQVLQLVLEHPQYQSIIKALPIAGESGTLKYRKGYSSAPLKAAVIGKTGTMLGVSNIAGFIKQEGKITASFVILQNGVSPAQASLPATALDVSILQQFVVH